jgi:hypothetical protein
MHDNKKSVILACLNDIGQSINEINDFLPVEKNPAAGFAIYF